VSSNWDEITSELKERAQEMHQAREAGLAICRQIVQTSSKCIRHVHRHQFDEARQLLNDAKALSNKAREAMHRFGEIFYAGYLHDSEKEMVEAAGVLAIVHNEPFPTPGELGVLMATYLNGMAEAASEVRRFALDEMRKGRIGEAERILEQMELIYEDLITFDFPDSMTGGLRRTCDALRAVIERTRSDLTATASQNELIEALRATREALQND
jgi:translin